MRLLKEGIMACLDDGFRGGDGGVFFLKLWII